MSALWSILRWDFIKAVRYNIVAVSIVITILYVGLFLFLPMEQLDALLIVLIFNDPVGLGMAFIGSLVLFEKGDRTLEALIVTPIRKSHYLMSKAISLTVLTLGISTAMAIAGHGWVFNYGYFIIGVTLSSLFFSFFGFMIVSSCKSFNEYIIKMAVWLLPIALPMLNFINVTDTLLWYILPTQATLILLEASFGPMETWKIIYSIIYLSISTGVCFYVALRAFEKNIVK